MLRSFAKCTTEHEASSRLIAGNACLRFTMTRSNARGAIGARLCARRAQATKRCSVRSNPSWATNALRNP